MKNFVTLFLLASSIAYGGALLTFDAPGASLQGAPGQTVTWNFHLSNDTNYLLIDQVDYLSLSNVGVFIDLFSAIAPVIGPGDTVNGSAAYIIDPPAAIGFLSTGQLVITYDEFLTDPNNPGFDFDRDHVNVDPETLSVPASVYVAAIPEPSTLALLLLGAGMTLVARRFSFSR